MKGKLFLFALSIAVLCATCHGEKPRKFKKATDESKKLWTLKEKLEILQQKEAELQDELENELEEEIDSGAGSIADIINFPGLAQSAEDENEEEEEEEPEDPCHDMHCGPGRECVITVEGEGVCQCVEECDDIDDERRKVCSNHNETWSSDCQMYKMRCLCSEGSDQCIDAKFQHVHIDYYGECQEAEECTEDEMADFPRRMSEWLFNVMRDMAERNDLSEHYLRMEKSMEENESEKSANAAIWKWCDLDGYPKDKSVSRHELFPIRAPLYTLEHCISPFLDACDKNDDHSITLKEWTACLQLSEELSDDVEDLCEDIRD